MKALLVGVALASLGACSLLKKTPLGGGDASSITADADDSPAVKNKLDELAKLETQLAEKQWADYARGSSREAQAPTPLQRLRSQAAEWRAGAQTARTGQIR